jgi:AraC-like DNA-binding protein/mannose-6-phosphate isomerase-like protein (cupin superfamily)
MSQAAFIPFALDTVHLVSSFYVDQHYSRKHAHALHQHGSVLELLYIYSGQGRYQVGSREYAVRTGDVVVCNAGILHGESLWLKNEIQTYCIALTGVSLPRLPDNQMLPVADRPVITTGRFQPVIHTLMPNIHDAFLLHEKVLAETLARSVLLMTWQELQARALQPQSPLRQRNETLTRAISVYLDGHYTESLRMDDLCTAFHLSRSYLSTLFKQETGLSPKQYLMLRRIGEAQSMLAETDRPIGEIEEALGFSGSVHFSSTFKKYIGISPREYRKYFMSGTSEL